VKAARKTDFSVLVVIVISFVSIITCPKSQLSSTPV
jgi:hypothetical protein